MSTTPHASRRLTSDVWFHFTKLEKKGKCHYCQHLISMPCGSSSNLKRHLRSRHPTVALKQRESGSQSRPPSPDAESQELISPDHSSLTSASNSGEGTPTERQTESVSCSSVSSASAPEYNPAMEDNVATPWPSRRRNRSVMWYHFTKMGKKGKCRYCSRIISFSSGSSSNLKRHLRSKHPTACLEWRELERRQSSLSADTDIQEISPHESSSLTSTSTSDEVQPRKKKKQIKESLLDEQRSASKSTRSGTDGGGDAAEELFCKFVASELWQMCSEVRQETKANIMAALTEGMRKQSALSFKSASQSYNQNSQSFSSPVTSTGPSFILTGRASPASIITKEESDFSQSS